MKKFNVFRKIHLVIIVMCVVMYLTGVFHLDEKWNSPIKHPVFGLVLMGSLILYLHNNKNRAFVSRSIMHNFSIRKGTIYNRIFRISVLLFILQMFVTILTGLTVFSTLIIDKGVFNFIYLLHASSRYTVIFIILIHTISFKLKKLEIVNRKNKIV